MRPVVLAEQSGSSPESGVVSRIKTVFDSLVTLTHGSESAGGWGDWGAMWNRIRSAAEWVPTGDADEADVASGKLFYKDSRTQKTGTASLAQDWSLQSLIKWDDYKNGASADGDSAGEESTWVNTAGNASTGVWKDTRTGLYWSVKQGTNTNLFTVASCDFFSTNPRGNYTGGDSDCGNAINTCANLSLDADGDSNPETDWYLPSYKELMTATVDGMVNNTDDTFAWYGFWSSTEYADYSGNAWRVQTGGPDTGYTDYSGKSGSDFYSNVRCVRRD